MAELAFLASIIQLADIGAKLSINLFSIAESVRSASADARMIAVEVSLFSTSLRSLGRCLENRLADNEALRDTTTSLMTSCKNIVQEVSALASGFDGKPSKTAARLLSGFRWTYKKSRISFLRSSLESLKSTMLLLIASVNLEDTTHTDHSEVERARLQVEVVSMMKVTEVVAADVVQTAQDHAEEERDRPAFIPSDELDVWTFVDADGLDDVDVDDPAAFGALVLASKAHGMTASQVGKLVLHNHAPLVPIGAARVDFKAQQLSYQYAASILNLRTRHRGSSFTEPSKPPSAYRQEGSLDDRELEYQAKSRSANNLVAEEPIITPVFVQSGKAQMGSENHSKEESAHLDDILDRENLSKSPTRPTQRGTAHETANTPGRNKFVLSPHRSSVGPDQADHFQAFPTKDSQRPNGDAHGRDGDEVLRRLTELILGNSGNGPKGQDSSLSKSPIRFKDAVGRKFNFPWHLASKWKGMEALIQQAFLHVDIIGQHVHDGHYDLVSDEGEIILPQVWDSFIQPDMKIEMKMWPMPEKKPPPLPPAMLGPLPPPPPLSSYSSTKPLKKPKLSKGRTLRKTYSMESFVSDGDKKESQFSRLLRRLRRKKSDLSDSEVSDFDIWATSPPPPPPAPPTSLPPPPPTPFPDDVNDVKRLMKMGFPRPLVIQALEKFDYNFTKALEHLTR